MLKQKLATIFMVLSLGVTTATASPNVSSENMNDIFSDTGSNSEIVMLSNQEMTETEGEWLNFAVGAAIGYGTYYFSTPKSKRSWKGGLIAAGTGAAGGGIAKAAGWAIRAGRYKNAGGAGVSILKNGKRRVGADWHKFKLNGRTVNRPHYHRGKTNSQRSKHRPWQGGW